MPIGTPRLSAWVRSMSTKICGTSARNEVLTAAIPLWPRAASISAWAARASWSMSLLPPSSCSCIWKPPETPSPGIAGGTMTKAKPLWIGAMRRLTSARITSWLRPALSRSAKPV